jgi:hopanoid biosynthesis associated protein HpnK
MEHPEPGRRLIVNADDFGRSASINQAVIRAHQEGILTTASLMVNEPAFNQAVALARQNPRLGVGLHLTLVCGTSTLRPNDIPGLVDDSGEFSDRPVKAGIRYFLNGRLRPFLRREMAAQFQKFQQTGLRLDHVNGHLHMHMHPTVFSILRHHGREWGVKHFRLTRDRFWLNARLASGKWCYRLSHAIIYSLLARHVRPSLKVQRVRHTTAVFGLLQSGRVTESFLMKLLPRLPPGDSELYSHPSLDEFKDEFDALVSPRVRKLAEDCGIRLIRYQDL